MVQSLGGHSQPKGTWGGHVGSPLVEGDKEASGCPPGPGCPLLIAHGSFLLCLTFSGQGRAG